MGGGMGAPECHVIAPKRSRLQASRVSEITYEGFREETTAEQPSLSGRSHSWHNCT